MATANFERPFTLSTFLRMNIPHAMFQTKCELGGCCIADQSSAYSANGPGFKTRRGCEFNCVFMSQKQR